MVYRCTWVLDSLAFKIGEDGEVTYPFQFKGLNAFGITPGNEFTVKATIDPGSSQGFEPAEDDDTNNSLFAKESGGGTAKIAYLRHLQNLDATGGYNSGAGENTTIKNAEQIATIWGDGNGGYESVEIIEDGVIKKTYKHVPFFKNEDGTLKQYNFIPINNPNLTGTYDGNSSSGKTIEDLYVNVSGSTGAGLFGTNHGTVKDVMMMGGRIIGGGNVGGLAGINKGTVENCSYAGELTGGSNIGGYVGQNQGTVKNCNRTTANEIKINVTGTDPQNIGGIVGLHGAVGGSNTGIFNCVNQMPVNFGNADHVGGIVGKFDGSGATDNATATMDNCKNLVGAAVTGKSYVGGLEESPLVAGTMVQTAATSGNSGGTNWWGEPIVTDNWDLVQASITIQLQKEAAEK